MAFRPFSLELKNRKIVVIGGGPAALRRINALRSSEAEIYLYALTIVPEIFERTSFASIEEYSPDQLDQAFMVLAVTDSAELNREICAEARKRGALANNAGDRFDCDFHFPAVAEKPPFTVAVSSAGTDLHGAIRLRDQIGEFLND